MSDACSLSAKVEVWIRPQEHLVHSTGFCATNARLSNRPRSFEKLVQLRKLRLSVQFCCCPCPHLWFGECCSQHATSEPIAELHDKVPQDHSWHITEGVNLKEAHTTVKWPNRWECRLWSWGRVSAFGKHWAYEVLTCPKETACLCPWTWQEICQRTTYQVEQCSDKGLTHFGLVQFWQREGYM